MKRKSRWGERGRKKKAHVNPKDICNYCKELGHWKKDCPMKKGKPSVVVVKEGSTSENELVLSVADHHQHFEDQWILDSNCSFHMCPNKTWFDTYEEKSGGNVFMGNDVSCKTIGIGTIKIKMHDGIIRTLTEVRHVLELKKNLISIGIMDGKGFK